MPTVEEWKLRLRAALREAMRAKDPAVVAVIREALAAIDNAEAAELDQAPVAASEIIAGAVDGLGAGEIARRQLGPGDVATILERELRERRDAATTYGSLGREPEAATLTRQADVLAAFLASGDRQA